MRQIVQLLLPRHTDRSSLRAILDSIIAIDYILVDRFMLYHIQSLIERRRW